MLALAPAYDLRTIDARFVAAHACGMFENNHIKALLVALAFVYLLATGPVQAGFMDFSVESLETEDSGGC
jgi:hypothetical protein